MTVISLLLLTGTMVAQTPEQAGGSEPRRESRLMARGYLNVNAAYQGGRRSSTERNAMPLYGETAVFDTSYAASGSEGGDAGAGLRVWRNVAIGFGVTRYRARIGVDVTAYVPHPLYFNRPREWQHQPEGYQRTELGVHLHAVWTIRLADRLDIALSAGPSFFVVDRDRVSGFVIEPSGTNYGAFQIAANRTADRHRLLGANAGIDLTYHFVTRLEPGGLFWTAGIGVYGRWSQAMRQLGDSSPGGLHEAGGAQGGVGLRFRF